VGEKIGVFGLFPASAFLEPMMADVIRVHFRWDTTNTRIVPRMDGGHHVSASHPQVLKGTVRGTANIYDDTVFIGQQNPTGFSLYHIPLSCKEPMRIVVPERPVRLRPNSRLPK
jgi:hypothetical protein